MNKEIDTYIRIYDLLFFIMIWDDENKDNHSYIKLLAVVNTIQIYSEQDYPLSLSDFQHFIFEKYDFQINDHIIKSYVEIYNDYYVGNCIEYFKCGRNNYYYAETSLDTIEAKGIVDLVYCSDFFTLKTIENHKKRIRNMFNHHF